MKRTEPNAAFTVHNTKRLDAEAVCTDPSAHGLKWKARPLGFPDLRAVGRATDHQDDLVCSPART